MDMIVPWVMSLEDNMDYGGYSDLKMLAIDINRPMLIICKNSQIKIKTKSNITYILYFCKTIFKDYYP